MTFPDHLPVATPADTIPGPTQGQWTYQEYTNLPDDGNRYEVINGVLFMTPAPGIKHQRAAGIIFVYLCEAITLQQLGEVFIAPCDVELSPKKVVQPDVIVLLNDQLHKITESHIIGSPALLVEVISPSSISFDRREKQNAYAQAGVPEYWIVDPIYQNVELLVLETETYHSQGIFQGQAILPSRIIPQFTIPVERFFFPKHQFEHSS